MSNNQTEAVVFINHPVGIPKETDFSYETVSVDLNNLEEDELIVELLTVSVDPYSTY